MHVCIRAYHLTQRCVFLYCYKLHTASFTFSDTFQSLSSPSRCSICVQMTLLSVVYVSTGLYTSKFDTKLKCKQNCCKSVFTSHHHAAWFTLQGVGSGIFLHISHIPCINSLSSAVVNICLTIKMWVLLSCCQSIKTKTILPT
jgi:hypothetical protein